MSFIHLSKPMHHRANLFRLCIPFAQRVECKVCFVFDPLDDVIDQFVDMRTKDFREIEVARFITMSAKDLPLICCFLAA